MLWFLLYIKSSPVLEKNSYVMSNGEYLLASDGSLVNNSDVNVKETTVIVYNSIDFSQPSAIVSEDKKKVLILDDNSAIVAKDTTLFENYEKYGRQCSLKKYSDQKICKALSHALDPTDENKDDKESSDDNKEKEDDKKEDSKKDTNKDPSKDLDKDIKEISNKSFSDSFIWSVDIADDEGHQRIINNNNKMCLTVTDGNLEMKVCDRNIKGQRWRFHSVTEKMKEKKKTRKKRKRNENQDSNEEYPHKRHLVRPGDQIVPVMREVEDYPRKKHLVEPGDQIVPVPLRQKRSKRKKHMEESEEPESQEMESQHNKRRAINVESNQSSFNQPSSGNQPIFPQQPTNFPQQPSNFPQQPTFPHQSNLLGPQTPLVPWYFPNQQTQMPFNYWPNNQPPIEVLPNNKMNDPPIKNSSSPSNVVSSSPTNNKNTSQNGPPQNNNDNFESSETSETPPEKTNVDLRQLPPTEIFNPLYNRNFFPNPLGPYPAFPPAVIVNNTTEKTEAKKEDKKKKEGGGLGGFLGGLAKTSPLGAALSG